MGLWASLCGHDNVEPIFHLSLSRPVSPSNMRGPESSISIQLSIEYLSMSKP